MRIETERLVVRDFGICDTQTLYNIKYDRQVLKYCPDYLRVDVTLDEIPEFIQKFNKLEYSGDIDTWRCYAIEFKQTGEVVGSLSFGKAAMLFEYELGWEMLDAHTGKGYASEAAQAFCEWFCEKHGVEYIIAIMDVDNPASYKSALKCGFKLFEKRTVYDYRYKNTSDYYYFRRYYSKSGIKNQFYGDMEYEGRSGCDVGEAYETEF